MSKQKIFLYGLLIGLCALLYLVFIPRTYKVPAFEKRADTQYWHLKTGSNIGYTRIPAKGIKHTEPIIYLHGGPGGHITDAILHDLSPLAENGYDLYLYDQIGSGHSDRLADITQYTLERHEQDLAEIIQQIGAGKVILLGQSWGAILATSFAADHPEQVAKLIFTGPGPIFPMRDELAEIKAPDSLQLRAPLYTNRQGNEASNNIRKKTVAWWAQKLGSKLASDEEMDNFQTLLTNATNKSTVCDTSKARASEGGNGYYVSEMTFQSLKTVEDPRPKLKNTKIPLYILRGQCDNQPWGYTTDYLDLFEHHQLVLIQGAGHSIATEQPELYLSTLRRFLAE